MYDPDCQRCDLYGAPSSAGLRVCVGGDGAIPNDVMLIGEAPGANEEKGNRPFIGRAGKLLDKLLEAAGGSRDRVFISNTVKCRTPKNRTPHKNEIEACRVYLMREIATVKPRVIVALGGSASKGLTGKEKIGTRRGIPHLLLPDFRSEIPVIVTYHPASLLYGQDRGTNEKAIIQDLRLAFRMVDGDEEELVDVPDKKRAVLSSIYKQSEIIGVDCEWTVLEEGGGWPWSQRNGEYPQLLAVGIAGIVDGKVRATSLAPDDPLFPAIGKIIGSKGSVYHNAPVDLTWLSTIDLGNRGGYVAGDTLLLASLLGLGNSGSMKLEALATAYTGATPWKSATAEMMGRSPRNSAEWDELLLRNSHDAGTTLLLHHALMKLAERDRPEVLPLYRWLIRAQSHLVIASINGIPMDRKFIQKVLRDATRLEKKAEEKVLRLLSIPALDRSLLAPALQARGVVLPLTEKTKVPSITKDTLLPYKDDGAVAALLKISTLKKLRTTYLEPAEYLMDQQQVDRLHTQYKLWAARSGRSSAEAEKGGTVQQYPRGKLRRAVRAREGFKIVVADMATIEMRIAAHFAQEKTLMRFFEEGIDVHSAMAGWVKAQRIGGYSLGRYLEEMEEFISAVTKDERYGAKPVNFGFLYGMHEETFIESARRDYGLEFTLDEATVIRDGFFELYPDLVPWHESAWEWVRKGYVDTPLGRRRFLPIGEERDDEILRKVINTPTQATASDLTLLGGTALSDAILNAFDPSLVLLFAFIHDAFLWEVRDDQIEALTPLIRQHMENPPLDDFDFELTVPLKVDIEISQTWG